MNKVPFLPTTKETSLHFKDAEEAVSYVARIYDANTKYLQEMFKRLEAGEIISEPVKACYPYVAITTNEEAVVDKRLSYGSVAKPGRYSTTLTRPDIFKYYYKNQFTHLLKNHNVPLEIGVSETPIPLHFAFQEGIYVESSLSAEQVAQLRQFFTLPELEGMGDEIANGTAFKDSNGDHPLALFTAPRTDYSLHRLRHYTGTDPVHFQNFILFTNYQFYLDKFLTSSKDMMAGKDVSQFSSEAAGYTSLVEPGNVISQKGESKPSEGDAGARQPQMPAYHLKREDGNGVTIINIGVGPSNARNISDHIAVLRPNAWLMLGHCAGLRKSQRLGDYVLAHAYAREDHVLDEELPLWIPIPALAEVQRALEQTVGEATGKLGYDLKSVMRTGTVVTTANRNWEIANYDALVQRFNQSRAIALDMESAVIAANGFRYRVPYGTLLCVSDRPLHGEIKLAGMANSFYSEQVDQHLHIGIKALELLRRGGLATLHSRKLRGFIETAFQ